MWRRSVSATVAATFIALLLFCLPSALTANQKGVDHEVQEGKKAAAKLEKDMKFVKDDALQKRVDEIGLKLSGVAETTKVKAIYGNDELADFPYTFKIVDDKDVNAFSLPGGYIYINKGLIDRVESDDELAGVMAHEIAHAAHHHMAALEKKESKYNTRMLIAAAIGMILSNGGGAELSQLLMTSPLIAIAKLNSYGREAERDSDTAAVTYMTNAGYNPVGLLTFIEKLGRDGTFQLESLGIYATHPPYKERADIITAELKNRNVSINRRDVSKLLEVSVKETEANGQKVCQVCLEGKPVFAPASANGQSSRERANAIAAKLDSVLDLSPTTRDVKLESEKRNLLVKNRMIINFHPKDAQLAGIGIQELMDRTKKNLNLPLYSNWLRQACW